jgi:hypothetical protein
MRAGNPPFSQDQFLYAYKAGFTRKPVWEMEGGVKKWVEGMNEEILGAQFPQTPPIFCKEDLVNDFFRQCSYREHEIKLALEMLDGPLDDEARENILAVSFPQTFSECNPYFGKACPYKKLCHGRVDDPLKEGFEYRVSHHLREEQQQLEIENEREQSSGEEREAE